MKNEIAMIMTILYLATGKQYTAGEVEARFSEFQEKVEQMRRERS